MRRSSLVAPVDAERMRVTLAFFRDFGNVDGLHRAQRETSHILVGPQLAIWWYRDTLGLPRGRTAGWSSLPWVLIWPTVLSTFGH